MNFITILYILKKKNTMEPPFYYVEDCIQGSESKSSLVCISKWLSQFRSDLEIRSKYIEILKYTKIVFMKRSGELVPWKSTSNVWIESDQLEKQESIEWLLLLCLDTIENKKRKISIQPKDYKIHILGFIHIRDEKIWLSLEKKNNGLLEMYNVEIKKDIRVFQLEDFTFEIEKLIIPKEITNVIELSNELLQLYPFKQEDIWCFQKDIKIGGKEEWNEFMKKHSLRKIVLDRLRILCNGMKIDKKNGISIRKSEIHGIDYQMAQYIGFNFLSTFFCRHESLRDWFVRSEIIYFIDNLSTIQNIKKRKQILIEFEFPILTSNLVECIQNTLEDRIYGSLQVIKKKMKNRPIKEFIESIYSECLEMYQESLQ
jgi:hypothetical protein